MGAQVYNSMQKAAPNAVPAATRLLRDTSRRFSCERVILNSAGNYIDAIVDPVTGETFGPVPTKTIGRYVDVGACKILRGYNESGGNSDTRQGAVLPSLPWRGANILNFMAVIRVSDLGLNSGFYQNVFGEWSDAAYSPQNTYLTLQANNTSVVVSAKHSLASETSVVATIPRTKDWMLLRGYIDYAGNEVMLTNIANGSTARASGDPAIWTGPAGNPAAGFAKLFGGAANRPFQAEATDVCMWRGARTAAQNAVIDEMMFARRALLGNG